MVASRPPWDRGTFRFWTWSISAIAILAVLFGVVALAVSAGDGDGTGTVDATGAGATASDSIDLFGEPPDGFVAHDPAAPPPPTGTLHQITIPVEEKMLEVAPGVDMMMWTFAGQVPGPVLRGKVGDTFEITLVNNGTIGHSIDFHARMVAWNDEMRTIAPGESLVYSFTAQRAGIYMYHCGTPPVIQHIALGMYGALIVDPPDLAPVDHEFVMMQSELYVTADGGVADVQPMLDERWDAVVLNGYVNQYQHAPIRVEPDERVRVWVLDDGPSENSSFHVIGTIFDTVYKEGNYLLRPDDPGQGGSQALDLQPAQGGFVEFSFDVAGLYPFLTHKMASASKGAVGMFQAGEVADVPTGGH